MSYQQVISGLSEGYQLVISGLSAGYQRVISGLVGWLVGLTVQTALCEPIGAKWDKRG